MARVIIDEKHLENIGAALRSKSNSNETYKPREMAAAIYALPTSSGQIEEIATAIIERTLSGSVTIDCDKIGEYGLSHMPNLTSLLCYATTLDDHALAECRNIVSVILPNVTTIGSYAFAYCNRLTNIDIPNVTTLSRNTFSYCTDLTKIDLGSNIAVLYGNIFDECSNLNAIIIRNNFVPKCEETSGGDPFPLNFRNNYTEDDAGYIYVPRNMISAYENFKTEYITVDGYDHWSNKKYRAIEDYPDICS